MKLRSFLDQKRLTNIAVNANIREQWLLDYIKCIGKPLQDVNNNELSFEQVVSEYVNYNGQIKSLKAFIDDQVDPIKRRTIIQESIIIGNYVFYGYEDGIWYEETDTNPTSVSGYFDNNEWQSEFSRENVYMLGYNDATWHLEDRISVTLSFLVHNEVYSTLNQQNIDELTEKLKRYVIAPYLFEIRGYTTSVTYNGTTDYINTKQFLNSNSIYKGELEFKTYGTQLFGSQGSYGNYYTHGISDQYSFFLSFGNLSYVGVGAQFNTIYTYESNGTSLKALINGNIVYNYDINALEFGANNECEFFFGAYTIYANETVHSTYTDYGSSITKDGITTYYTAHPAGYLFDNFGNIYYNREATYNEFPLNVELTII